MNQATQPVKGRGSVLTAVAIAVAVIASLAFASFASAAANPVAAGSTTTVTLNSGFMNKLKKNKIKLTGIKPATVKGKVVTLPIEEGTLDVNGQGELTHSGGLKLKAGKKSTTIKALVLNTTTSSLSGKLGGKSLKIGSVSGVTATRSGFGTNVAVKSVKLTGKAAKELNKKLGFTGKKKNKKGKTVSAPKPFKGNQVLGGSSSATQPKTIGVLAQGTASLITNIETDKKFEEAPPNGFLAKINPVPPTELELALPPVLKFPISGGNVAPNGLSGVPQTKGGVDLVQNLGGGKESTISLKDIWIDLSTLKATAEVTVTSTIDPQLNLGSFGRTSISDLNMSAATIKVDEAAKTITVTGASATLQETTAEVINKVFGAPFEPVPGHPTFKAGDPLGSFSFTVATE